MEIKQKDFITFYKKAFQRTFLKYGRTGLYINLKEEEVINQITKLLLSDEPFMIARFGSTELQCLVAYLREIDILKGNKYYEKYHWDDVMYNMHNLAGFFPKGNKKGIIKFCKLILNDIKELNLLASWRKEEYYLKEHLKNIPKVQLNILEPYLNRTPWSAFLKNKKVLIVHPFSNTIQKQYLKRDLIFENKNVLPTFELETIQAVQTIAGNPDSRFITWFDALDHMKSQISSTDFDVALIGCGAYGFPLAAHVKRIGRKAIHMGGALQILFGIRGKRWDTHPNFSNLMNEHWVYPMDEDIPNNKEVVEGGCYWK